VYAGFKWLHEHASELGVDTSRIAIMGDSAGGGITASLAHYIKLKGGPAAKKQILIYPMLDDKNLEVDPNTAAYATWTFDDNKTGWGALLGDKMGSDNVDPIEAAGRMTVEDARGLPPCYMDVSTHPSHLQFIDLCTLTVPRSARSTSSATKTSNTSPNSAAPAWNASSTSSPKSLTHGKRSHQNPSPRGRQWSFDARR
jgi:carboxypeptidase C (cathepsin A)